VTRVSNLFRLQTLDSQIDSHQSRLAEIEAELSRHPELDQAQADEAAARAALETVRQAVRRAEEETRHQQQRIAETDKTLYGGGVRNPKELQDLQEEAASLRRYLSVLEERQLQTMMQSEEGEKTVSDAQSRREGLEQLRAELESKLRAEQSAQQGTLETLGIQRDAALSEISPEDLEKYTSIRRAKRGLAVTRMEGGSCAACGVAPSTSRVDSARSGQDIVQCGNCGRILYLG
jgi:predicted  nucleic acid-binding Zn-ribbon protein